MNIRNFSIYLLFVSFFLGCSSYNDVDKTPSVTGAIVDNEAWYSDMNDDVIRVDVTIPIPNAHQCAPYDDVTAPTRACTLEDIMEILTQRTTMNLPCMLKWNLMVLSPLTKL